MKQTRLFGLAALALGALTFFAAPSHAQKPGKAAKHAAKAGHGKFEKLAKELNLTDDQKAKIKPIIENQAKQVKAIREDKSLNPAQQKDKLRSLAKETRPQIEAILTPDQLAKLKALHHHKKDGAKGAAPSTAPAKP
jgi:Spy/CpxP family protein refolding chaperone